jgi:hypothetical protein
MAPYSSIPLALAFPGVNQLQMIYDPVQLLYDLSSTFQMSGA